MHGTLRCSVYALFNLRGSIIVLFCNSSSVCSVVRVDREQRVFFFLFCFFSTEVLTSFIWECFFQSSFLSQVFCSVVADQQRPLRVKPNLRRALRSMAVLPICFHGAGVEQLV